MVKRIEGPADVGVAVDAALASVHDPEIPPLSIVDLGIVERVDVSADEVLVELLPTFAGCPALDAIREDVERAVAEAAPGATVRVRFVHAPPWTSDRITPAGREALRTHGLTPPGTGKIQVTLGRPTEPSGTTAVLCPFCGSEDTVLESAFGPTLCRSTRFCKACRNPFEAFKAKLADR